MTDILTHVEGRPGPTVQSRNDEALVREATENPAAFATLYRRHVIHVYRYLLARVGDEQDAQDLTAQTFLAALEGIASYRGQGGFSSWLLGIARHKATDHFRQRREALPLDAAIQVPQADPLPEAIVAEQLRRECVFQALQCLSPDRAEALTLRIFAGLSTAEVSQVMGKSEAAVRMLVHRAVRDLRGRLAPATEAER